LHQCRTLVFYLGSTAERPATSTRHETGPRPDGAKAAFRGGSAGPEPAGPGAGRLLRRTAGNPVSCAWCGR